MNGVSKLLPWREKKAKAASSSGKVIRFGFFSLSSHV
jgi:hypothetical protein